jgi:predicted lipoprotein with Yx(FWY)xxD motif
MASPAGTMAPAGQAPVMVTNNATLGNIITDWKGWTLYLYTRDQPNVSNCYDQCATNWPPLLVSGQPTAPAGLAGTLGTTTRRDGTTQLTYNGAPLYYWARDTKAGDTTGQNVGGVWFVMEPGTVGFPTVKTATIQNVGTILTDLAGKTLYRFTNDRPNETTCYDQCATNWPPLVVSGTAAPSLAGGVNGEVATIARRDGSRQVTYNGTPLYYFARDAQPGDTTGQGVNNVWFVVEPAKP